MLADDGEMLILVTSLFQKYGLPILMTTVIATECMRYGYRKMNEWRNQVRDENFLIGQTLHNVDELVNNNAEL